MAENNNAEEEHRRLWCPRRRRGSPCAMPQWVQRVSARWGRRRGSAEPPLYGAAHPATDARASFLTGEAALANLEDPPQLREEQEGKAGAAAAAAAAASSSHQGVCDDDDTDIAA